MKVIIIEDELTASEHLESLLQETGVPMTIVAVLQSVHEAVQWIDHNPPPQLAFMDIQLADDNSFNIFKQTEVNFPVIFTTAYDEYILEAFEVNSIDYLLKPINAMRLQKALNKVKQLEAHFLQTKFLELLDDNNMLQRSNKRFIVKKGLDYVSVKEDEIAYIFTAHKITFLVDVKGNKYILDKSLSVVNASLKPQKFFRANRKYLVNIESINKFKTDNGKLLITLSPSPDEDVVISKENAPAFRKWIGAS